MLSFQLSGLCLNVTHRVFAKHELKGIPEMTVKPVLSLLSMTLSLVAFAAAAHSGDEVRSDASCQELWVARNQIYKDAGYCFKTARAREHFGNAGCTHDNVDAVPLSDADRRYIAQIKKLEAQKGC
jgi:YARHG domain